MQHKFLTSILALALCATPLLAQEPQHTTTSSITFTTEGLWNTTTGVANWINILNLEHDFSLWRNGFFALDMLSSENLRHEQGKGGVADDLHIFSAIEDSSASLSLTTFGVGQHFDDGRGLLYVGIRNLGKDYFAEPWNSVFTSAMNGLYPSISTNFVVADAPLAAMSLHAEWYPSERWGVKLSVYDGVASRRWDELFRLNLRRDGFFSIGEVGYKGVEGGFVGSYRLGATLGYAPTAAGLKRGVERKVCRASVWTLIEQPLYRQAGGRELHLVLHGAWAPRSDCDLYGAGAVVCRSLFNRGDYLGFMFSRGLYRGGYETLLEFTYSYRWRAFKFQPALHRVHAVHSRHTIAMMKIVVEM